MSIFTVGLVPQNVKIKARYTWECCCSVGLVPPNVKSQLEMNGNYEFLNMFEFH